MRVFSTCVKMKKKISIKTALEVSMTSVEATSRSWTALRYILAILFSKSKDMFSRTTVPLSVFGKISFSKFSCDFWSYLYFDVFSFTNVIPNLGFSCDFFRVIWNSVLKESRITRKILVLLFTYENNNLLFFR